MTFTVVASGTLTYDDVSDIVEALTRTEGRKYPIPGMDFEDTAQEIRAECLRVLSFYDQSRIGPSPFKFLQTCVRNFLYNKRRGIWVPNNPPCTRCPMWNKASKFCTAEEVDCRKIVQHRKNMNTKAALKQPASLEVDVSDPEHELAIDAMLLDESIREAMPPHLVSQYEKMLAGEHVTARIKRQVRDIVSTIIHHA
jgi:hypothetical protein